MTSTSPWTRAAGSARSPSDRENDVMPVRRVTLDEIAQAAGVSVPMVSRVLNGRGHVSPPKRELIQDLLRQHSYQPRKAQKRTAAGLIHVVFEEIDCAVELEHLRGMEPVARDAGVGLVVTAAP